MQEAEVSSAYAENTGKVIVKAFRSLYYQAIPAVLWRIMAGMMDRP
jgi:hypothetical protein